MLRDNVRRQQQPPRRLQACLRDHNSSYWSPMQQKGFWIRIVYALCLLGACINHIRALVSHGWWREGIPLGTAVYWDSLTVSIHSRLCCFSFVLAQVSPSRLPLSFQT